MTVLRKLKKCIHLGGDQRRDSQPDLDHSLPVRLWRAPDQLTTGILESDRSSLHQNSFHVPRRSYSQKDLLNFYLSCAQCSGAGSLTCGICECEDPHYGERYSCRGNDGGGAYLIFVISFTQAGFSNTTFYTQKYPKNSKICTFSRSIRKILHLTELFYTGTACGARDKYHV